MLKIEKDKVLIKTKDKDEYLPGIVESISIGGSIIYEKQETDDKNKRKVLLGYDDKTISITLKLFSEKINGETIDIYNQLAKLEKLFKKSENSVPQIYTFIHPMAKARGISKVLFQKLESSESIDKNIINVTIDFIEFTPAEIIVKENEQSQNTNNNKSDTKTTQQDNKTSSIVEEQEPKIEWKKYFEAGKNKWK
ncbi:MAG: hypothetical protein QXL18_04420 [Candidatus Woesearchaeota archaeon]